MNKEGNDDTNERPESVKDDEDNVKILQDCENEQVENSSTQRRFKRGDQHNYNLEEKMSSLKYLTHKEENEA